MDMIWQAVGAIFLAFIAEELFARSPLLARWLLNLAIRNLPASRRERCREEWSADLEGCKGPLTVLAVAIGFFAAALRIRNDHMRAASLEKKREENEPIPAGLYRGLPYAVDRALAALVLLLLAPLLLLIALAVRLDTPGPIFYRQRRLSFSQQPIAMLKFRTMHAALCDPIDARSVRQATLGDPRVTRVGRFLRRTSLDELPQLINVLRGEMSMVGPRPHAVAHDRLYAEMIDDQLRRYRVKPGITGWAQVNGFSGEPKTLEEMRRRLALDLEYIHRWSIRFHFRVLARTVGVAINLSPTWKGLKRLQQALRDAVRRR